MSGSIGCPGQTLRKYNIFKRNLQQGTAQVPMGNNVNGFVIKNAGNTIVLFNNEPLQPGESQSVGGNEGEIFDGRVDIYFRLPTPAPGTPVNSAWITVKYYV
jgi:hypothetical protein